MTRDKDAYKSTCSICALLYLVGVSVAIVAVIIYFIPQLVQFCGGALVIGAFVVACAWALRRK